MTVCIAALADNSSKLVLATDQMITANIPISYQFETENVKKIYKIKDNAAILTAGNALFAYEIVNEVEKILKTNETITSIEQIAQLTRNAYQNLRREKVITRFIEPRGLTLESYLQNQTRLHNGVVQEIEQALINFNIDVELIVAGFNDSECHLFSISHPGDMVNHDAIGYVCSGSGAPHATYYLIGSDYKRTMSLDEVKKLVKEAKKKSEVAPGVGKSDKILELYKKNEQSIPVKK